MVRRRIITLLSLLLTLGSSIVFSANYQHEFGDDWTQAETFVREHHADWKPIFDEFGVDARIAEAIVFPELIRYSHWQDAIETATVKGVYVSGGSEKANFSIGRFQMKPSFAEEIDQEWNQSTLASEFGFKFDVRNNSDARSSRVKRLGTIEGQCRYLAIFIRLMYLRHPKLQSLSVEQQVRFLATAYNRNHRATWQQIIAQQKRKTFHTDLLRTRHTKTYRYCEISVRCFLKNTCSSR